MILGRIRKTRDQIEVSRGSLGGSLGERRSGNNSKVVTRRSLGGGYGTIPPSEIRYWT